MSSICYHCMHEMTGQSCPACGHGNADTAARQPKYALPCGAMLRERYVVGRVLGQGGFGITYMGYDAVLQSRVCIKEYYPAGSAVRDGSASHSVTWSLGVRPEFSQAGKQSFVSEARKAVKLRDLPSVVKVWDVFYENETAYIVMEFIEGMTLKEHLAAKGAPMTLQECCEALEPVMKDLQAVHDLGIIHRDISPDNLMRRKSGELVLLDLGAAKDMTAQHADASMLVARKGFSPAEQYVQGGQIGPWTDVYALAATIYYCMTGHAPTTPVERSSGMELNTQGMPPALADFFRQGLALQAKDRFKSMEALRKAMLATAKATAGQPFRPAPVPASARQPSQQVSRSQRPVSSKLPAPLPQQRAATPCAPPAPPQPQPQAAVPAERSVPQAAAPGKKKKTLPILIAAAAVLVLTVTLLSVLVFIPNGRYKKALALADKGKYSESIQALEALNGYKDSKKQIKNVSYRAAVALYEEGKYEEAIEAFEALNGFSDSADRIVACRTAIKDRSYDAAVALLDEGRFEEAMDAFKALDGYRDSADRIVACENGVKDKAYEAALALMNAGKYEEAASAFEALKGYKDSDSKYRYCRNGVDYAAAIRLFDDGQYTLAARTFFALYGFENSDWYLRECRIKIGKAPMTLSAGFAHTVALKNNGTAVAVGTGYNGECNVSGWKNIVSVCAGWNQTVGLRSDGTVVATGKNDKGQCNVSGWKNIVAIATGKDHTVGLKADGTVVAVGNNDEGQCNVSDWTDIVAISAGVWHTIGLKADGTVVAVGEKGLDRCNVSDWHDIIAITTGSYHTVGLVADGTVVEVGTAYYGYSTVSQWTDIVAIGAGNWHTLGVTSDGSVVASLYTGRADDDKGQGDVYGWSNIVAVEAGSGYSVGLRTDGTVVAVGYNAYKQCNVSDWNNIWVAER